MAELRPENNFFDPGFQGYNPFGNDSMLGRAWNAIPNQYDWMRSYVTRPRDEYIPPANSNPYGGAQLGSQALGIYDRPRSQYQGDQVIRGRLSIPQPETPAIPRPSTNQNTRDYNTYRGSAFTPINYEDYPNAPGSAASYLDSWMNWGGGTTNWLSGLTTEFMQPQDELINQPDFNQRERALEGMGIYGVRRPYLTNEYLSDQGIAAAIRNQDIAISPNLGNVPIMPQTGWLSGKSRADDDRELRSKGVQEGYDTVINPGEGLLYTTPDGRELLLQPLKPEQMWRFRK